MLRAVEMLLVFFLWWSDTQKCCLLRDVTLFRNLETVLVANRIKMPKYALAE